MALCAGTLAVLRPSAAQVAQFTYFPTASTVDGRMLSQGGTNLFTLTNEPTNVKITVPAGATDFQLGIFDGDTGRDNAGNLNPAAGNWDLGTAEIQYRLFADPLGDGSGTTVLATFTGNAANSAGGVVSAISSPTMPNNQWWSATISTSAAAQAANGSFIYRLEGRLVDPSQTAVSDFKVRSTGIISLPANGVVSVEASLRQILPDGRIIYPQWDGTFPAAGSDFFLTTPTTYDGNWTFFLNVPSTLTSLQIWDGGADHGSQELVGLPSGVAVADTKDTDDPDTPNGVPSFATGTKSVAEGAKGPGLPRDDNQLDIARRTPAVQYRLIDPSGNSYLNANPSGNQEWEQFVISAVNATRNTADYAPNVSSDGTTFVTTNPLPSGQWRIQLEGLDLGNVLHFRIPFEVAGVGEDNNPPAGSANGTVRGSAVIALAGNGKGKKQARLTVDVATTNGQASGSVRYNDRLHKKDFRSTRIDSVVLNGNRATITGIGTVNRRGSFGFTLEIEDQGTPGAGHDRVRFFLNGQTPPTSSTAIKSGNVTITPTP
ncbi:MAG TPA: hypothetical protein VFU47_03405 [Armatimonadota bacterium]|nr:hypothetical protein [Armatimonadota bacterium]